MADITVENKTTLKNKAALSVGSQRTFTDGAQRGGSASMFVLRPADFESSKARSFFWQFEAYMQSLGIPKGEWKDAMYDYLGTTETFLYDQILERHPDSEWGIVKMDFLNLFTEDMKDNRKQDAVAIAEAFLKNSFDRKSARAQLIQLKTIMEAVKSWSEELKADKLFAFLDSEFVNDLLPRVSRNESLEQLFDKAIALSREAVNKPQWVKRMKDKVNEVNGVNDESNERSNPASDVAALSQQLARLTLLVEQGKIGGEQKTIVQSKTENSMCFYCNEGQHFMRECQILMSNIKQGYVMRNGSFLCLPNGEKLLPNKHGLRYALKEANHQVNVIEMKTFDEIEDAECLDTEVMDVDAAEKRKHQAVIEKDRNGIPIVKRARAIEPQGNDAPVTFEPMPVESAELKKGTEHKKPAFMIKSAIEMPPIKQPVEEAMNVATVTVPLLQFLSLSNNVDNQLVVKPSNVGINENPRRNAAAYSAKAIRVQGEVNGEPTIIVIDPGSELNIANRQWLCDLGIGVEAGAAPVMVDAGDHYSLLLGLPFLEHADWQVGKNKDGIHEYILTDGTITIRFRTAMIKEYARYSVNQIDKEIPDGVYQVNLIKNGWIKECDAARYKRVGKKINPVNIPLAEDQQLDPMTNDIENGRQSLEGGMKEKWRVYDEHIQKDDKSKRR
ncbi:hypothetical protein H4219_006267, partial [Mycoemilia scoparia]